MMSGQYRRMISHALPIMMSGQYRRMISHALPIMMSGQYRRMISHALPMMITHICDGIVLIYVTLVKHRVFCSSSEMQMG
jgi:hypothetical protein